MASSSSSTSLSLNWKDSAQVLSNWDATLQHVRHILTSRKTGKEKELIKDLDSFIDSTAADLLPTHLLQLLDAFFVSNSRVQFDPIVNKILRTGLLLPSDEAEMLPQIISRLDTRTHMLLLSGAASGAVDPETVSRLLYWVCLVYDAVFVQENRPVGPEEPSRVLYTILATVYYLFLACTSSDEKSKKKERMCRSGVKSVTHLLERSTSVLPSLILTLLTEAESKTNSAPLRIVPLLALALHVSISASCEFSLTPAKNMLLSLYTTHAVMAKEPLEEWVLTSFTPVFAVMTEQDLDTKIVPAMEKAVLRKADVGLNAPISFFSSYTQTISPATFQKVLIIAVNSASSSNPSVRSKAIDLFAALCKSREPFHEQALDAVLDAPKKGKTIGAEHRATLYSMLINLPPNRRISKVLVTAIVPLLMKENHDLPMTIIEQVVPGHLAEILKSNTVDADVTTVIAKELATNKTLANRRRVCVGIVGEVIWSLASSSDSEGFRNFSKTMTPIFEASLRTFSSNPTSGSGSVTEAYIALSALLSLSDAVETGGIVVTIPASYDTVKPSFFLSPRVYAKLTDELDQKWFSRALRASFHYPGWKKAIRSNEAFRMALGSALVHLTVEGKPNTVRKEILDVVEGQAHYGSEITSMVRQAVVSFLSDPRFTSLTALVKGEDENAGGHLKGDKVATRIAGLLIASVSFTASEGNQREREEQVIELLILSHLPVLYGSSRNAHTPLWITLCQKAGVDPLDVVNRWPQRIVAGVVEAFGGTVKEACQHAITTLAFVSPGSMVSAFLVQLQTDLNEKDVQALGETELGIWSWDQEGVCFVDVLSTKSDTATAKQKGKNAEMEKWEADLRKSIASKTTTKGAAPAPALTKQEQTIVAIQLEKEAVIRRKVNDIKDRLGRGLGIVDALTRTHVDEFKLSVGRVAEHLLSISSSYAGRVLVGQRIWELYLALADMISFKLDTFRKWVGIATLRALREHVVPEEFRVERLGQLILRVLHRLRYQSESSSFDAATFSYAFPLLQRVLLQGGVGTEDDDEKLEQVAVGLDVIKFHVGEFSSSSFPRPQTLQSLLHVIRSQPKQSKEASSALVELGEVISASATKQEADVLISGTLVQEVYVRNSCLQALQPFDLTEMDWSPELLIACHDADEQNARLATHIWEDNGLDVVEGYLGKLLPFLGYDNAYVRWSTADAIADAVEHWPESTQATLAEIEKHYRDKAKILAPEYDEYGMVIAQSLDQADPWPTRVAISRSLELLAPFFPVSAVQPFFHFLIQDSALGDREADVRKGMLSAGAAVIDLHGADHLVELISMFEEHLSQPSPGTESGDHIKEAVVILFGRLARHLDDSDSRIPGIVERLVEALKTPAEQVQIAVSDCLSPLVKFMRPTLGALVDDLFETLLTSPKYAARRGSAYGLAGVLKGTGIAGFKEFNVILRLKAAAEDKKNYEPRQGAMFAFETLSHTLGRLFEPYITFVLPLLLSCFGDGIVDVREATQDAARVIMGNMSGYGVKLILPSLLSGLDEKQWRTKKGSIELLGMMAYCSPRQLSISLPIVIPRLTGVLTDSHAQVRTAANKSLKQFGEVISNPEIQNLVPVLLKALVDPAKTSNALSSLLKTSFMHYIDHSSLALVIPILERGLRERGADIKKKAAQIVGNLASLTDSKDFVPYLSELLPLVHVVLVDPVPEARATAAKSLGTLVERLGEVHFPELVPSLLRTLKTDTSGVDRQGAAQGLSEVLAGLGMERMEGLLPDIISNAQSPRPTVREGFMSLLVFLPATFGTRFQPHLPKIITPILNGLSDTEEYVRDAAMRAGRMVITNYSTKAIDLLLPELEHGMFDPGWRIRHASITLIGELLFKVSGITGKTSDLEEEELAEEATAMESSRRALVDVLGTERRDRLLASLYLVRQDAVAAVRTASLHIWKALVNNTPRTVREVLPELINQIVSLISGNEFEQQETAGRTVAELCRKFGEKIIGEIMVVLRGKASSTDSRNREGVCLTLCDIMENATDTQREDHEDEIISVVRVSLVDDEPNVRSAAAKAFDILQETIGAKAIDQTIPTLLEALRQPGKSSGTALHALREVMNVRATTVFPVLIPTLTAIPMTVFNARALAALVTVAGEALSKRLTVIMGAFVRVIEEDKNEELLAAVDEALRALLASVNDAEGLNTLMMILLGWTKHDSPRRRVSGLNIFAIFCAESALDSSLYRVDWIRQLVSLLDDPNTAVHTAAFDALDAFVKSLPKDELEPLVVPLRRSIESSGGPGIHVPGFSLAKGVSPMVPIIIAGLTTGSNEQREAAAYAIGDLVERTAESAIKPFVVPFTGPLIRVATQAGTYPPAVKTGILSALSSMLERIPIFVKPFFPQLQRTFVKSASDPASIVVRTKAASALGILMKNQPRVDPVVTELITGSKSNEESIAASLVLGLANVVANASANLGDKSKEACVDLITEAFRENHDEHYLHSIARLVASLSVFPDLLRPIIQKNLVVGTPPSVISSITILTILRPDEDEDILESNVFSKLGLLRSVAQKVLESSASDKPSIAKPAREARDLLKSLDDDSLVGLF